MTDWSTGLTDFTKLVVRDRTARSSSGASRRLLQRLLPAGRPRRAGRSPYPYYCPWNPYTLGSVMGIQAGHAASVSGDEYYGRPRAARRRAGTT